MNRRVFLQSVATAPVARAFRGVRVEHSRIEYVAGDNEIVVVRREPSRSETIQRVRSQRPGGLVFSPNGEVLFAVNQVEEYGGLPTGSVESFAVSPSFGTLERIGRQALALSSTVPRDCSVSPDRKFLVVAAYGGGSYNVLPVLDSGRIGPPHQVMKEIGRSVDPVRQRSAHPHSVAFHPQGQFVIGTDLGSDRINVFCFRDGRLLRVQQRRTRPGSGPAEIRLDASGSMVTIRHELKRITARYQFDPRTGNLDDLLVAS